MILLFACADPKPGEDSVAETAQTEPIEAIVSIAANPVNPYSAVVTVTVDEDAEVTVTYGSDGQFAPTVRVPAGVATAIPLFQMRAGRSYDVSVQVDAERGSITETLTWATSLPNPGMPVCTATFSAPEEEFSRDEALCTNGTTSDGAYISFCTDRWGEVVHSVQGSIYDSLFSLTPMPDGGWVSTSNTSSKVLFMDSTGAITDELIALTLSEDTRFEHWFIDGHESIPIRSGEWAGTVAILTSSMESFTDGSSRIGNGLILIDTTTHLPVYDYSFHGELGDMEPMDPKVPYTREGFGDFEEDWTHANSVANGQDDDGRDWLLISLKSQDWIVKLYPDTDEIAWVWGYEGDFTLVDDIDGTSPTPLEAVDWPFHVHAVQVISASGGRIRLRMLDNGYPRRDESGNREDLLYSRAVEVTLDETTLRTAIDWSFGGPDQPDFFNTICGNVELMPDGEHVLIGEGERGQMRELSYPGGEERWRMSCNVLDLCHYRAHAFPSMYETTWRYE